ncbi:putative fimbrial chaperone YadV [Pseudomonas fluorescens]|uniref:Putative fimbrial chaperone YadV n=1 Tax=Pseudomonas fluorescens TaxID=294 RepID=A0A5E6U0Q3_PSEFL|nr:putative fimbrial chaperone YadV [Pseudomonas fluorescens]
MFALFKQTAISTPTFSARMIATMLALGMSSSQAALTLNGTRVVLDSDKRNASLVVTNPGNQTFAVQTWVNTADDDAATAVPFISSPSLFRLNPGKEQQVRINGLPNDLPTDRESLFYFNVQEIPQATVSEGNVLNIALRTRIKMFYRPSEIKDKPLARLKDLQWTVTSIQGEVKLEVYNPTPFHVSFITIAVKDDRDKQVIENAGMVAPLSRHTFALKGTHPKPGLQVEFSVINDYGGYSAPLSLPIQIAP